MTSERPSPELTARYVRFFRDVMAAHRVSLTRDVQTCECGAIPSLCPVHRTAVRTGLVDPANLSWTPLPEDLPRHRPSPYPHPHPHEYPYEDQGSGPGFPLPPFVAERSGPPAIAPEDDHPYWVPGTAPAPARRGGRHRP